MHKNAKKLDKFFIVLEKKDSFRNKMLFYIFQYEKILKGVFYSFFNTRKAKKSDIYNWICDCKNCKKGKCKKLSFKKSIRIFLNKKESIDFFHSENEKKLFSSDEQNNYSQYFDGFLKKYEERCELDLGNNKKEKFEIFFKNIFYWRQGLIHNIQRQNGEIKEQVKKEVFGKIIKLEASVQLHFPILFLELFRALPPHDANCLFSYIEGVACTVFPHKNNREKQRVSSEIRILKRLLEYAKKQRKKYRRKSNSMKKKGILTKKNRKHQHKNKERFENSLKICGKNLKSSQSKILLNAMGKHNFEYLLKICVAKNIPQNMILHEISGLWKFSFDVHHLLQKYLFKIMRAMQGKIEKKKKQEQQNSDDSFIPSDKFSELISEIDFFGMNNNYMKKNIKNIRNALDHNKIIFEWKRCISKDMKNSIKQQKQEYRQVINNKGLEKEKKKKKKKNFEKLLEKIEEEQEGFAFWEILFFIYQLCISLDMQHEQKQFIADIKILLKKIQKKNTETEWNRLHKNDDENRKTLQHKPYFLLLAKSFARQYLQEVHAFYSFFGEK